MSDASDKIRIVQESVAGKEITFAHVIGGPAPIIYQKLGLNPAIDYGTSARSRSSPGRRKLVPEKPSSTYSPATVQPWSAA